MPTEVLSFARNAEKMADFSGSDLLSDPRTALLAGDTRSVLEALLHLRRARRGTPDLRTRALSAPSGSSSNVISTDTHSYETIATRV